MVFANIGLKEVGKVAIRGESGDTPTYFVFAGSGNTFIGTETLINNDYLRKTVTWFENGYGSKYYVELSALECIGSYIYSGGLINDVLIGSDYTLFTLNETFVGSKNDTFSVQVEGEIIVSRRQWYNQL